MNAPFASTIALVVALLFANTSGSGATIVSASAGFNYTMFRTSDGYIWGVGQNNGGQLADGAVWGIGVPDHGEVPYGTTIDRTSPVRVATGFVDVRAGLTTTAFLTQDGSLWIGGTNAVGQFADGTSAGTMAVHIFVPRQVASGVSQVELGSHHTVFLKSDKTLHGAGSNLYGQLGDGTTMERHSPVTIASDVTAFAAGTAHNVFVKSNGTLWATGWNVYGQLGDGTTTNRSTPVQMASGVVSVATGVAYTMFIKSDGTLWGVGQNNLGQLGDGSTTDRLLPVQVATQVLSVVAGDHHTVFIKTDGTMWGMGNGSVGRLGANAALKQLTPIQIAADVAWVTAGGNGHTIFKTNAGGVWAMGGNGFGQLGDGTQINRSIPVEIVFNEAPVYTTQPISRTVLAGAAVTFAAAASGTPTPSYQWRKNGVNISGASSATLALSNVQSGDAGIYTVVATNSAGTATSDEATLVINIIPAGFDVTSYLTRYPAVAAVYGTDLYGAWLYYRDHGIYDGEVFDDLFRVEEYLTLYPELFAVFGSDLSGALMHWLTQGSIEGRLGRIPLEFSATGYLSRNPDVSAAVTNDPLLAWSHYWLYGIYECRAYDEELRVFEYLAVNADLTAAFVNDWRAAALHWMRYGRTEGRLGRLPLLFNVTEYLTRSPDVGAAWGTHPTTVFLHYWGYGIDESRTFDDEFRPAEYLALNADLAAVFGSDLRGAFKHWVRYGRGEGRPGKNP